LIFSYNLCHHSSGKTNMGLPDSEKHLQLPDAPGSLGRMMIFHKCLMQGN
jgi:hypothetical protein